MSYFHIGIQVIIRRDNAILLGRRAKAYGRDTWGLPGGLLEFGESFEKAATREICEETSLALKQARVFTVLNDPSPESHHVQIGVIATDWSGTVRNLEPDKCHEWRFFSLDRLPKPLFPSSQCLIDIYTGKNTDYRFERQKELGGKAP